MQSRSVLEFEVAVIGAGCLGAAIACELARRGHRQIALLDNGAHSMSATSQSGGMIRVFHESPVHTELALENFRLLQSHNKSDFKNESSLLDSSVVNGSLYFFSSHRLTQYQPMVARLARRGHEIEILDLKGGSSRFPNFGWKKGELAIHEPMVGSLDPNQFISVLHAESVRRGVEFFDGVEVLQIAPFLDVFRICTAGHSIIARKVILAGGARLLPMISRLGIGIPLSSVQLKMFRLLQNKNHRVMAGPNYFDRETLAFARLGRAPLIVSDLETAKRLSIDLRSFKSEYVEANDSYAPNRIGFVGELPGTRGLYLVSGWGGTAFKFSLAIAERAADCLGRAKYAANQMKVGFYGQV